MEVIFILIGFSLLVAIGFLVAFIWSVRNGQYEDDYTPSVRILFDDELPPGDKGSTEASEGVLSGDKTLSQKEEPKT